MMNYGDKASLRGGGPCEKGHAFEPIAPSRGRPGYTDYHCSRCGEWTAMQAETGQPEPPNPLEARVAALEAVVHRLANEIMRMQVLSLPAPAKE